MSELFETEEEKMGEVLDEFQEAERDLVEASSYSLDARRRLENILEEKRLRDELDDFIDD